MDADQSPMDAALDACLSLMHAYTASYPLSQGYPTRCPGMDIRSSSSSFDADTGALEEEADRAVGQAVAAVVDAMPDPHRTFLRIQARNLHTGATSWHSLRLPLCPVARASIRREARALLQRILTARGLL